MATSENDFQKELCDAYNAAGGHAFKASNAYQVGVPDLSIQPYPHPAGKPLDPFSTPHIKMECKFIKVNQRTKGLTKKLSQPQADHLAKTINAGGIGVWVIGYTFTDKRSWGLFLLHSSLSIKHNVTMDDMTDPTARGHFIRPLGGDWPVQEITNTIYAAEKLMRRDLYANWEAG